MRIENATSLLVSLAALAGAAGVSEAAYAAHGAADPLLQTSSHFLLVHAAAVIAIAGFARAAPDRSKPIVWAATLLMLGTIVFCSDLSLRAFTGAKFFPMAAPIGGTSMIAGWLCVAVTALLRLSQKPAE